MAGIKDKVVTVESLAVLHESNKNTYMPKTDPTCSGIMTMDGNANFSGEVNANNVNAKSIVVDSNIRLVSTGDALEIVFLN